MAQCNECNGENEAGAKFCVGCGGRLQPAPDQAACFPAMRGLATVPAPAQQYAAMRGMAPAETPATYAPMRGMAPEPRKSDQNNAEMRGMLQPAAALAEARHATDKNAVTAVLLSFLFPGGGQFYNRDLKKGGVLFLISFLAWLITTNGAWVIGVPISLGAWIWGMLDARKVARCEKALW